MDLCSQADDIREFLFSHRFLEHAQVVTHQQGPPNTVFMQHGPPLPDFTLKLTELYVLAADAYLESVMSGAPNVLSVSFRIQTLVGKLLKHLNAFEGAMGERERKLLKFPFFVAITMMTSELAPQVRECFRLLEAPPCKKAMKEVSASNLGGLSTGPLIRHPLSLHFVLLDIEPRFSSRMQAPEPAPLRFSR